MSTTPDQMDLPFVKEEIERLHPLLSPYVETTVLQNPRKEEVLSELPNHDIVHFACHGFAANDPSQSTLLLNDWKTDPLTVTDLAARNNPFAGFAYLSACNTSGMRDFRLLDESISLSSAVQQAGYSSVVGTLWQVSDLESSSIAQQVYSFMVGEDKKLDIKRAAEGLHWAVQKLRESKPRTNLTRRNCNDPLIWVPYMHIGI